MGRGPRHTKPTSKNWWWRRLIVASPHVAWAWAKELHHIDYTSYVLCLCERTYLSVDIHTEGMIEQHLVTALVNVAASNWEYVWYKVANGTGEEAEAENKEKLG